MNGYSFAAEARFNAFEINVEIFIKRRVGNPASVLAHRYAVKRAVDLAVKIGFVPDDIAYKGIAEYRRTALVAYLIDSVNALEFGINAGSVSG